MNRDEFIDYLGRLVADGLINEERAAELVRLFDANALPEGWELPLPPEQSIVGHDDDDVLIALLALSAILGIRRPQTELLPSYTATQIVSHGNEVQATFERRVRRIAAQLANGELTVAQWQIAMTNEMRQHLYQQMMLGSRRGVLSPTQIARADELLRQQSAFVQRFADEVAARQGLGFPLTELQVGSRSEQYGGFARGELFRQAEASEQFSAGWLIRYNALDDAGTCSPCHEAQGYYLPGQGPMPGEICLGRSRCRCERVPEYNPAIYAQLTGQNRRAAA